MYNIIFLKTKQGRSTWSLSAFLLPVVFGEQKVPYVIFSHFCFHYFAVVVVESSENKYTWENGWFFFYPAGHWPIFHFCLFFLLRFTVFENHWKSLIMCNICFALEFNICLTLSWIFPFTPSSIFIKSSRLLSKNASLLQVYFSNF